MKKSAAKKKARAKKKVAGRGPRRQVDPVYESICQREKETVKEIIQGGRTAGQALEVGLSAQVWTEHCLGRFDRETDLPRPIACATGCGHCCFNQVELTPPEALIIGHFVEQHFPPAERERLLAKAGKWLEITAGKNKPEIARLRRELPCPLLQDNRCLVYPVRPLACRAMHSLDAGQCDSSLRAGDLTSGAYYAQRHELVLAIVRGLQSGCRSQGCQADTLTLPQALQDYFRQPEPLARWIKGEPIFAF